MFEFCGGETIFAVAVHHQRPRNSFAQLSEQQQRCFLSLRDFMFLSTGVFSSGMWFTAQTCRLIAGTETLFSIFVYGSAECLHSDKAAAAAATLSTRLLWIMEKAQLFFGLC